jgi:hypothetical protein
MRVLGAQDDGADLLANRVDLPGHPEGFGYRTQGRGQLVLGTGRRCLHAHEEVACAGASVLLGVGNVAAGLKKGSGYRVDDAGAVGAGECYYESGGVSHTIKPTCAALLYC